MTLTDEQLRETLSPLRAEEPTDAEVAAAVAAARPAPGAIRRRRPLRVGAGVALATASVAAALSVLPGSPEDPASRTASGPSVLRAAAAVAAEQPSPAASGAYRYTEWLDRWSESGGPTGTGPVSYEQRVEAWIDENYEGREIRHPGRILSGDSSAAEGSPFYEPSAGPYVHGDGPRTRLAELPTEPDALRDALVAEYEEENWAPGLPTPAQTHYDVVRKVLYLLGQANDPELRVGLFELLAHTRGVQPAPGAEDPRGRTGRAVRIPTQPDGSGGTITVIFDADSSELLSWSEIGTGGGTPDQSHTILDAGQVETIGERPGD